MRQRKNVQKLGGITKPVGLLLGEQVLMLNLENSCLRYAHPNCKVLQGQPTPLPDENETAHQSDFACPRQPVLLLWRETTEFCEKVCCPDLKFLCRSSELEFR